MRWSIIRLIWLRDLRDQLRDRRTLFMIAVLPVLLYPALGYAFLMFAQGSLEKPSTIGIVRGPAGSDTFPERDPAARQSSGVDYPPLVRGGRLTYKGPAGSLPAVTGHSPFVIVFLPDADEAPLKANRVDVLVSAPPNFYALLERAENEPGETPPPVKVQWRKADTRSRQALQRLIVVLEDWKRELNKARLARKGLPSRFEDPFEVQAPGYFPQDGSEGLFGLLIRLFPFMLVMWSLAGALYPAVDLCAGEKERGTMETLLISPAGREEIVLGKFLTIWTFSAATAFLNLASMGFTFSPQFSAAGRALAHGGLTVPALLWCLVLLLPTSAFFSAISLAVGAYARSSKEGQYYLMPLMVVTLPLALLTLVPGVDLGPFYSLVPVTGVTLLMQRLMTAPGLGQVPWLYFIPVLAPMALYGWIALRWAIEQFKREEVLFREAERLDIGLWLRRLFREKEPTPTTAQAVFCFVAIIGLRWFSFGLGTDLPALVHTGVSLVAFVATPPLFMALLLNTRPREGLYLRLPAWRDIGVAVLLTLLLLPPLAGLTMLVFNSFPELKRLLEDRQPFVQQLSRLSLLGQEQSLSALLSDLSVFALLAAFCEEIAFRGFILSGLQRRFRPRNAVILSSFLFALFHMNVFQFLPAFFLGVVLGLLTVRSKSLLPAIIFHFLHNGMLITTPYLMRAAGNIERRLPGLGEYLWPGVIGFCMIVGLALLWWLYREPYVALERKQRMMAKG